MLKKPEIKEISFERDDATSITLIFDRAVHPSDAFGEAIVADWGTFIDEFKHSYAIDADFEFVRTESGDIAEVRILPRGEEPVFTGMEVKNILFALKGSRLVDEALVQKARTEIHPLSARVNYVGSEEEGVTAVQFRFPPIEIGLNGKDHEFPKMIQEWMQQFRDMDAFEVKPIMDGVRRTKQLGFEVRSAEDGGELNPGTLSELLVSAFHAGMLTSEAHDAEQARLHNAPIEQLVSSGMGVA